MRRGLARALPGASIARSRLALPTLVLLLASLGTVDEARAGQCGVDCDTVCVGGSCDFLDPQSCVQAAVSGPRVAHVAAGDDRHAQRLG